MSERMDMIPKELHISKSEDNMINDIQKTHFFHVLKENGFAYESLKVIFESEIYTYDIQNDLNIL